MHGVERIMCGPAVQHVASMAVATWHINRCLETVLGLHRTCPNNVSQYVQFYILWVRRVCVGRVGKEHGLKLSGGDWRGGSGLMQKKTDFNN